MQRNAKEIGYSIKLIRKELGLTMEEFGKKFDPHADKSNVSKWEKGACVPNNRRLKEIAKLGNTTVADLIFDNKALIPKAVHDILPITIPRNEYDRLKDIERKWNELTEGVNDKTTVQFVEENGKKIVVWDSEAGNLVIENDGIHYEK
ncbi:helix-turn-helix domain-containing protein [Enterococcus casseliflavus]|uniref:helix-turn-helix domain-containing protein n=1 Tax=Enterococcus casseliflavus TaxID=37734 RepID=UPI00289287EB|nr:helix-turn-helix transcriptional regulator [Enterococcus casseliflavus]MDT2990077.1 helix-turn-helix transcriptional regulator [Enterococcus casseliflavus]